MSLSVDQHRRYGSTEPFHAFKICKFVACSPAALRRLAPALRHAHEPLGH
jgi:hypothetical protein